MGFIYKITNKLTKKCYIGSTKHNPEIRWKQHLQSINKNTGCPALKDAVKKYGVDNFKFEVLIICFDEDRYIYEKQYIKKFNSQVPNGYNILEGGEGGGFVGKKHTEETKQKLSKSLKKFYENPEERNKKSLRNKEAMKKVDMKKIMANSENYKKAVKEGRVGGRSHKNNKDNKLSEETKQKIRESVLKYYKENDVINKINIEKHRNIMANATGKKVNQYTTNNEFIKEYISISEAGRTSGVKKRNIQQVLSGKNKTAGGYIWKFAEINI